MNIANLKTTKVKGSLQLHFSLTKGPLLEMLDLIVFHKSTPTFHIPICISTLPMQPTIFNFFIFLKVYKSTLISSSCLTLVVSPPILSSPPYTDIPGIRFVSSSLPPAWSLKEQVLIMMY